MQIENNPAAGNRNDADSQGISVKELLLKYLHHSWLFLLILALALLGAWLHLRYTQPKYSVSSTLLIRNDNTRGGSQQDIMFSNMLLEPSINKQNEIEILQSRTLMNRVVRSLGLQMQYYVVGNVKTTNIYKEEPFVMEVVRLTDSSAAFSLPIHILNDQKFRIGKEGKEYFFNQVITLPQGDFVFRRKQSAYSQLEFEDFIVNWLSEDQAAMSFEGGLTVKPANDLSNVLELTYVTGNPRLGSDILNSLMEEYNQAAIEDKNETNRRIVNFLDDRLSLVERQLDSVERDLQLYKSNENVIDIPAQSEFYLNNLGETRTLLQEQEIQLNVANLLEDYIGNPANRLSLVPSTLGLTDPTLLEQVSAYNKLVMERDQQLQTGATPTNIVIQNLEKDIEESRHKMQVNLANIKKAYQNTITSLESKNSAIRGQLSSIPAKEKGARERARQQEIKQNLYLYLLQKREESSIALASTISNARVVDSALSFRNQISPKSLQVYGIALLIGLVLPVVIIYLMDLLNDKVTTRTDISRQTNAPILAEIGHSEEERVLLFPQKSRTVIAEQLRILRTNLRFLLGDKYENPTILVTSSFSGEGKSFISTNLGGALAVSGKRTVILEFDLRKPKILAGLGLKRGNGVTNYLVGGASLEELPQPVPGIDNLYVIPCGPVPPNPSELLLTPKTEALFKWVKKEFDAVVIDTAPVGLVSDAITLSQFADSTLYVIRQRYTYKRQIQFIDELYREGKIPHMGLLVNDVVSQGSRGYYGYGGGRYGYGYGYGYGSRSGYYDEQKTGWFDKLKKLIGISK